MGGLRNVLRSLESVEEESDVSHDADLTEQWMVSGKNYFPCTRTVSTMPAGKYTIERSDGSIFFAPHKVNTDELLILPDSTTEKIMSEINTFWERREVYEQYNLLWKRGVFLWGPPGSGKTATVHMLANTIVERGGVCLFNSHPKMIEVGLKAFRSAEPDRPLVVILEDIDAIIEQSGESTLLALLDGEVQVDNVCFIATTNYPERLDARIVNRPSRFDIVELIDMPSADSRRFYLTQKGEKMLTKEEIDRWVEDTDYMSLAHLKELLISVKILEVPYQEAIDRLKTMNEKKLNSSAIAKKHGFGFTDA